jgi:hypothetical protein
MIDILNYGTLGKAFALRHIFGMLAPDDLPQGEPAVEADGSKDRPLWIYREQ